MRFKKIVKASVCVALLGVALLHVPTAGATKPNDEGEHKVTLCHATDSYTNPYVEVTVDVASVHFEGHVGHTGPVFYPAIPKHTKWGDIIPSFDYGEGHSYAGMNLSDEGLKILENGCNFECPVTTTTEEVTTSTQAVTTTTVPNTTTTLPTTTTQPVTTTSLHVSTTLPTTTSSVVTTSSLNSTTLTSPTTTGVSSSPTSSGPISLVPAPPTTRPVVNQLPITGVDVGFWLVVAIVLIGLGWLILYVCRPRMR